MAEMNETGMPEVTEQTAPDTPDIPVPPAPEVADGEVVITSNVIDGLFADRRAAAVEAEKQAAEQEKEPEAPASEDQAAPVRRGRSSRAARTEQAETPQPKDAVEKEAEVPVVEEAPEQEQGPIDAPRPSEQEQIIYIKLSELHPFNTFRKHPFGVRDDAEMKDTVKSIKEIGVQSPALVRPREDGGYEIISGHRRHKASELAGYADMPCIVREMNDFEAVKAMKEGNKQRTEILPSEKARLLDLELESIKRQGSRGDLSAPGKNGNKEEAAKRSNAVVAENNNMSVKNVQRYIKLNELVPDLMKMVDEKKIAFTPAVELAHVKPKNQRYIAVSIEGQGSTPSLSQAQRMRELEEKKLLNPDVIDGILLEQKKEVDKVILNTQELSQYFGQDKTPREMKDTIMKLLDEWKGQQKEIATPEKKKTAEKAM